MRNLKCLCEDPCTHTIGVNTHMRNRTYTHALTISGASLFVHGSDSPNCCTEKHHFVLVKIARDGKGALKVTKRKKGGK